MERSLSRQWRSGCRRTNANSHRVGVDWTAVRELNSAVRCRLLALAESSPNGIPVILFLQPQPLLGQMSFLPCPVFLSDGMKQQPGRQAIAHAARLPSVYDPLHFLRSKQTYLKFLARGRCPTTRRLIPAGGSPLDPDARPRWVQTAQRRLAPAGGADLPPNRSTHPVRRAQ
jgi:hypothetical protein